MSFCSVSWCRFSPAKMSNRKSHCVVFPRTTVLTNPDKNQGRVHTWLSATWHIYQDCNLFQTGRQPTSWSTKKIDPSRYWSKSKANKWESSHASPIPVQSLWTNSTQTKGWLQEKSRQQAQSASGPHALGFLPCLPRKHPHVHGTRESTTTAAQLYSHCGCI